MMARRTSVSDEAILLALIQAGGHYAPAAHILGVSPRTLARWLDAKPELIQKSRDILVGHVEIALVKKALAGDLASIKEYLQRYGGQPWETLAKYKRRLKQQIEERDTNCTFELMTDDHPDYEKVRSSLR